ncbi:response regulator transcription factor [Glycomyces buryatensis]|nr:LuxR C-terminal-related transcriptional regulator [Glycomyces buryatensis]
MGLQKVLAGDDAITVIDAVDGPWDFAPEETDVVLFSYCSVCDMPAIGTVSDLAKKYRTVVYSGKETPFSLLSYRDINVRALLHQSEPDESLHEAVRAAAAGNLGDAVASSAVSLPGLSQRESLVLTLISEGYTNDQMARRIGISKHTVDTYIRRIRSKLKLGNRAQLACAAMNLANS